MAPQFGDKVGVLFDELGLYSEITRGSGEEFKALRAVFEKCAICTALPVISDVFIPGLKGEQF